MRLVWKWVRVVGHQQHVGIHLENLHTHTPVTSSVVTGMATAAMMQSPSPSGDTCTSAAIWSRSSSISAMCCFTEVNSAAADSNSSRLVPIVCRRLVALRELWADRLVTSCVCTNGDSMLMFASEGKHDEGTGGDKGTCDSLAMSPVKSYHILCTS